jgi:SET domain-containing protein
MPQTAARAKSARKSPARTPEVQVRKSAIHGRGLFAAEDIARGTRIGRYEGPRTRRNGAYVLWVEDGDELYGVNGKNHLRFVNHSSKPNAFFDGEELYARKRIRAGEEITFHYGEDWD